MARLVFIGSTGGGVLSRLVRHQFVRELTLECVSDRDCGFLRVSECAGIPALKLAANSGAIFSDSLYGRYKARTDLVYLSFYTKLITGDFLRANAGRIYNCHPSILPAFKGMKGFEDTINSNALFMGCSLHEVDEGVDSGACVIQAAMPLDRRLPVAVNRHKIFLAQYYSSLQFIRWICDGRLDGHGRNLGEGARYGPGSIFSPNLDDDFFDFIGEPNELLNS